MIPLSFCKEPELVHKYTVENKVIQYPTANLYCHKIRPQLKKIHSIDVHAPIFCNDGMNFCNEKSLIYRTV